MTLTPEVVEYAKKEVGIKKYFVPSETCIANHILFNQFIEGTKWKSLPKVIFYILMNEEYGLPHFMDENKNLGYKLSLVKDAD